MAQTQPLMAQTQPLMAQTQEQKMMGVLVCGLPQVENCDGIRCDITGEAMLTKLFLGDRDYLGDFHLHTTKWWDGTETSDGDGVFLLSEEASLSKVQKAIDLSEEARILRLITHVCRECFIPLKGEKPSVCTKIEAESSVEPGTCEKCNPSPILCCCCSVKVDTWPVNCHFEYVYCPSCSKDRVKQEEWRYRVGADVRDTSTRCNEKLYLSDEAIAIEKHRMGGIPPTPCDDDTPFFMTMMVEDLIDPESIHYWPYGMNAQQYLEYNELRKFNNPMEESFGNDSWMDVVVTGELLSDYIRDLDKVSVKYDFKSPEEPGSAPDTILYEDKDYKLVKGFHSFTCDGALCQAVFQHHRNSGASDCFTTFVTPIVPIYTSRPGNIHGNAREAGYGDERCLACVDSSGIFSTQP